MMGLFDWLNKKPEPENEEVKIKRDSDFSNFKSVTDYIYEKSGIIDLDKRALTSSRLQQYAIIQEVYTTEEFLSAMVSKESFYQEIINKSTVNETFFMREVKELEWLIQEIESSSKKLKILSMPSSSGEEAYSILLMMALANIPQERVDIYGYDINSDAISNAQKGEYDEHSLHKIDKDIRDKYFSINEKNHFEISPLLKNNVSFFQKNIFDLENIKEKYDIILSRNMFIYFDDEKRKIALDIIVNMLNSDGIFIKGHADKIYKHPNLEHIHYGIYKKVI